MHRALETAVYISSVLSDLNNVIVPIHNPIIIAEHIIFKKIQNIEIFTSMRTSCLTYKIVFQKDILKKNFS